MRRRGTDTTIKKISLTARNKDIVIRTTHNILDIGVGIVLRITTTACHGEHVGSDRAGRSLVVHGIRAATATIKTQTVNIGDENIIVSTTDHILDMRISVTLGIATGAATADQIDCHACRRTCVADGVTAATSTIKIIGISIGDKSVAIGTADHILNMRVRAALCRTATTNTI